MTESELGKSIDLGQKLLNAAKQIDPLDALAKPIHAIKIYPGQKIVVARRTEKQGDVEFKYNEHIVVPAEKMAPYAGY